MNLSNVSIPYADLSSAYLQNTDFTNSNLHYVIFDKCYCKGTIFSGANMRDATFGILPDIKFGQRVNCVDVSKISKQNKQMLIVGGGNEGKIGIYDVNTTKTIREW